MDERAVQWSSLIVEARLESVDRPQPLRAAPAAAPATASSDNSPANASALQLYTFQVTEVFDGDPATKGKTIHVLRLTSPDAPPARCPATLAGRKVGDTFILLLRSATEMRMQAQPSAALDAAKDSMVVVHLLNRSEIDAAAIEDLRKLIKETRESESAGSDDAVTAQVTALAVASDDVEAEEAEKSLSRFGPKVLQALRSKASDADVSEAGKTRISRLIDELTPPPLAPQPE